MRALLVDIQIWESHAESGRVGNYVKHLIFESF